MLEAVFTDLERGREVEDRLTGLDGDHASRGERAAVANAIDVVDDRTIDAPRPQEVRVQRVHATFRRNGLHRGRERLSQHLSAEHGAPSEILALAAEEVLFDS